MNWMRRKFTNLSQDMQFFLLSLVALVIAGVVLSLAGCSVLTEQVWTPEVNPESVERCVIVYQQVRWNLAKQGECKGWAEI